VKLGLRQFNLSIFFIFLQLNAQPLLPAGDGNDSLKVPENAYARPLGLCLDSIRVNVVTRGQFRLYDNNPFEILGDTLAKAIPVQDRFGNSCPKYYIRKTVLHRNSDNNRVVLFKERALFGGFVEYVVNIPPADTLKPILVIEKPRFALPGMPFRARWISTKELYHMVRKDGIDTRHYHRRGWEEEKGKVARLF
jgi:hypothetical protein